MYRMYATNEIYKNENKYWWLPCSWIMLPSLWYAICKRKRTNTHISDNALNLVCLRSIKCKRNMWTEGRAECGEWSCWQIQYKFTQVYQLWQETILGHYSLCKRWIIPFCRIGNAKQIKWTIIVFYLKTTLL